MKFLNQTGLQHLLSKLRDKYLAKDNVTAYTPTSNYNPATKKYVDDMFTSGGVSGSDTIDITDHVISLKINAEDKVLQSTSTGVLSTVDLTYDSTAKKLKLWGKDATTPVAEVDMADFLKDSFLDSAVYDPKTHIITFTFNTESGKDAIEVDLSTLVDTYTAGNGIAITDNAISVKVATSSETTYISVGADGLKVTGLDAALSAKVDKVSGKDLSTNDYTTAEKDKLANIAAAATADDALSNDEIDATWNAVFV